MNRGGKFLVSTTILAVAACGGQDGKLEIRSTPTPLAQGKQPVPYRIAEARGQLALGNVALALESFRIAAREDPNSIDAFSGIALCYDQMGRYDLSRRNYETALSLAPGNLELLSAFAASLQLQGRTAESLSVRQEIAARSAAAAAPEQLAAAASAPVMISDEPLEAEMPVTPAPVRVVAKVEALAPVAAAVQPEEDDPLAARPALVAEVVAPPVLAAKPAPKTEVKVAEVAQEKVRVAPVPAAQTVVLGPTVTMSLPAPRPAESAPAAVAARQQSAESPVKLAAAPAPVPVQAPSAPEAPIKTATLAPWRFTSQQAYEPVVAADRGPRLERISMGEIALITQTAKPVWVPTTVAQSQRSATVRFVPLRQASMSPVRVRLLNAARVNRLAARTRTWLAARGWNRMSIGNATVTRSRSVILYPADKKVFAQRLSRQFGFPIARRTTGSDVTVLLGADAVRNRAVQPTRA